MRTDLVYRGRTFILEVEDADVGEDYVVASLSIDPPARDGARLFEAHLRVPDKQLDRERRLYEAAVQRHDRAAEPES